MIRQNPTIGLGRSAKPLCAGSIPARASNPFNNLDAAPSRDQNTTVAEIVAGRVRLSCRSALFLHGSSQEDYSALLSILINLRKQKIAQIR